MDDPLLRERRNVDRPAVTVPGVTDETLVVRNYGTTAVSLDVTFVETDDAVAFDRTYRVAPGETISTPTRLPRGVYRVVARLSEVPGEQRDTAECLVGSAPGETALVETGNGLVSVTDGIL
ncbi:MAG: hypothetical protein V5A25_02435 [Halovenus sp.]